MLLNPRNATPTMRMICSQMPAVPRLRGPDSALETDDCCTYHGFEPAKIQDIIDFIFVDRATIRPMKFQTISKTFDGAFYSDHYAVCADLVF